MTDLLFFCEAFLFQNFQKFEGAKIVRKMKSDLKTGVDTVNLNFIGCYNGMGVAGVRNRRRGHTKNSEFDDNFFNFTNLSIVRNLRY